MKQINFVFVLAIGFALLVCASGVANMVNVASANSNDDVANATTLNEPNDKTADTTFPSNTANNVDDYTLKYDNIILQSHLSDKWCDDVSLNTSANGNLYLIVEYWSSYDPPVWVNRIDRIAPSGERSTFHTFPENTYPRDALTFDSTGNLYRIVEYWSSYDPPVWVNRIDRIAPSGERSTFHTFPENTYPRDALTFDSTGNLYRIVEYWSSYDPPVWVNRIDRIAPSGERSTFHTFPENTYPRDALTFDSTGNLYLIVEYWSSYDPPVWVSKIDRIAPSGERSTFHTFPENTYPRDALTFDSTGNLYLIVEYWSSYDPPVWVSKIDRIAPSGERSTFHTFPENTYPRDALTFDSTGNLYLIVEYWSSYDPPVWVSKIDRIAPSGERSTFHTFPENTYPRDALTFDSTGNLYLIVEYWSSYDPPVWVNRIDRIAPSGERSTFHTFPENTYPRDALTFDSTGNLYLIVEYWSSYDPPVWVNRIDRIAPSGERSTFHTFPENTYPCDLTFAAPPVPIILVHGYYGKPEHLTEMKSWLENDNFTVYLVNYTHGDANGDIKEYANNLSSEIERIKKETGAKKVDIVAHSMGGLVSRYYIQNNLYKDDVRKLIMLGTPNHGSEILHLNFPPFSWIIEKTIKSFFCHEFSGVGEAGKQMTPNSPFLKELGYEGKANYYTIAGTHWWLLTKPLLWGDDDGLVRVVSVKLNGLPDPYERYLSHCDLIINEELYNDLIKNILLDEPIESYSIMQTQQSSTPIQQACMVSGKIYPDEEKSHDVIISSAKEAYFSLAWLNGDLNLTLTTPNGVLIDPSVAANDSNITYYWDMNLTIAGYNINNPESGTWKMNIAAVNISEEGENYTAFVFLNTNLTLSIELQKYQYEPNEQINITANLTDNGTAVTGASVIAKIYKPNNATENITLYDDGLHNDSQANDGIYSNTYTTAICGSYGIIVSAFGTVNSEQFEREAFTTVWVEQYPDLTLNPSDISFSSETPTVGEHITINATIHNIGEADANNASILFYDGEPTSGEEIGEDVVNVSVNATANASVSWLAKAGVHEIHVLISPYNEFLEENYTNNMANKTIEVNISGDLDHDGEITPTDAAIALNLAVRGEYDITADVSRDGRVTSLDALMILQAAAGGVSIWG